MILFEEGKFTSQFYGIGHYEIGSGFETEITLHCKSKNFNEGLLIRTYFENKILEKPRIILNADMNHYYEKID
ncbi:hypothetical protein [Riemerella anatipestifer]|uniref:hypothetical protein n=1 Tax=Riemerella anatipestifer TaxID=34085 RepID=UPI0009A21377|nr:hypothetical protein [Riemerella anatipestifer]